MVYQRVFSPASDKPGHISSDDGIIGASNWALDKLVLHIADELDFMVIDNTGLKDKYDYNLYWEHEEPLSIVDALNDQLGLIATKKKMEIPMLIVEPKEEGNSKKKQAIKLNRSKF